MIFHWLAMNNEISYNYRTVNYLANGLGGAGWTGALDCACVVYSFPLPPFISPADDPAPWYTTTREESAEFLGLMITDVKLSSPVGRVVTPIGKGGVAIGPATDRGRTVEVEGVMFASSECGMRYGEQWISGQLRFAGLCPATPISPCYLFQEMEFAPCCSSGFPDDVSGRRSFPAIALIEGPSFEPLNEKVPQCYSEKCKFILQSTTAFMLTPGNQVIVQEPPITEATFDIDINDCDFLDGVALLIEVYAGEGSFSGVVTVTNEDNFVLGEWTITDLPAQHHAWIDGRTYRLWVDDGNNVMVGSYDIIVPGTAYLNSWPIICGCDEVYHVTIVPSVADASSQFLVSAYNRET